MTASQKWFIWTSRLLILIVLAWNLDAAISFIMAPAAYLSGFELGGVPGEIAIAGTGLLFLMWQVPYIFALINPKKYRLSLIEALIMQTIGLVGESILLSKISNEYALLQVSITRFIIFDGIGVMLLTIALALIIFLHKKDTKDEKPENRY